MLVTMLSGKSMNSSIVLSTELTIRESCGYNPKKNVEVLTQALLHASKQCFGASSERTP